MTREVPESHPLHRMFRGLTESTFLTELGIGDPGLVGYVAGLLARFVPIVRTFAPFVAGVGKMSYGRFIAYNVIGGVAWVLSCTLAGYFFGNIPVVREHFTLVVLGIVLVSVLPMAAELIRSRGEK